MIALKKRDGFDGALLAGRGSGEGFSGSDGERGDRRKGDNFGEERNGDFADAREFWGGDGGGGFPESAGLLALAIDAQSVGRGECFPGG